MPGPVWLILPTYDEAASLAGVVAGARTALADEDLRILVIDDASPDGTGALAERLGAEVLQRPRKLGLGSAYVAGFARALAAGATVDRPIADQFYGDRVGGVVDPYGFKWSIATHKEDLTPEELKQRAAAAHK